MDDAHPDDGMSVTCDLFTQISKNTSLTEDNNFFMDDGSIFIRF